MLNCLMMVQYRPSSAFNSPFMTTNSGAPVWNNNNSLTVGTRGISLFPLFSGSEVHLTFD